MCGTMKLRKPFVNLCQKAEVSFMAKLYIQKINGQFIFDDELLEGATWD